MAEKLATHTSGPSSGLFGLRMKLNTLLPESFASIHSNPDPSVSSDHSADVSRYRRFMLRPRDCTPGGAGVSRSHQSSARVSAPPHPPPKSDPPKITCFARGGPLLARNGRG